MLNKLYSNLNLKEFREGLTDLEKEFNYNENRFEEVRKTIGSNQSEGIYPSLVGFKRSLIHTLLKILIPVPFTAILVFVDSKLIAMISLLVLSVVCFVH